MLKLVVWWAEFLTADHNVQVRFPVLPWGSFLEGEDSHGDPGLLRFKNPPRTPYPYITGQHNRASWASQPQKSVTLRPKLGGETTKPLSDMWRY
jgi:hypothetical protein